MKYIFLVITLFTQKVVCAQSVFHNNISKVFVIRHAEKQAGSNPLLTTAGNQRAGDLMRVLKNEKIQRIYVTQYKRTQHTADSLRIQLNIDTVHYLADTSCVDLFNTIQKNNDWDKPILIISHGNILPKIIYKLGITDFPQEDIPDIEFDNLFIVEQKESKLHFNKLKYGQPS